MAVYNGEKYLHEQLDSILNQLQDCDELVVSYDTSKDNTLEIVKAYSENDKRVKLVINDNPGLFENFQNAISHCNGQFIFISDQDDIWVDGKIEKIVDILKDEKYGMVIHNGVHIDGENNIISDSFFDMYGIGPHKLKNFLKPRYSGCCIAFTSSIKDAVIPFPKKVGAYDHWLGEIGSRVGNVHYLNDVLIHHRLHSDNYTPTSRRKMSVVIKARYNLWKELSKRKKKFFKEHK